LTFCTWATLGPGFVLQAGKDNRVERMGNGGCHDHGRAT